ncbi:MAG: hypothetical protein K8T10_12930 [Candidatus Eremiobacteraeota bacterium]|nr:hypothetical protein [Candidatus Eremiobacteraeota bacterium]
MAKWKKNKYLLLHRATSVLLVLLFAFVISITSGHNHIEEYQARIKTIGELPQVPQRIEKYENEEDCPVCSLKFKTQMLKTGTIFCLIVNTIPIFDITHSPKSYISNTKVALPFSRAPPHTSLL